MSINQQKTVKKRNPVRSFLLTTICSVSAMGMTAAADAQTADALSYKNAMKCSALHGFYMAITDKKEPAWTKHEEHATRWLNLAMVRDGEDGKKAENEYQSVLELLIAKANSMENDIPKLQSFLGEGFSTCQQLQVENDEEFSAVEVE